MSEVFWVGLYTSGIAFLLALSRQIYKSKCQSLKCWGCELQRDVVGEEKLDEIEMEQHTEEKSNDKV